jgi:hypothetical protein
MTEEPTMDITPPEPGSLTGLGRLPAVDPRNTEYPLPRKRVSSDVRKRFWNVPGVLDQGATSQCVAYTGYNWLRAGPCTNLRKQPVPFTPAQLYKWAQDLDEWPGSNYDGTSGTGLMKALKREGYILEYRWAFDVDTIFAWLLTEGPVCFGSWWYRDMFMPTHDGWIRAMGPEDGGHEYLLIGADRDKKSPYDGSVGAVRMLNSWGANWGQKGRAWISRANLEYLLKNQGDCCTATEVKK